MKSLCDTIFMIMSNTHTYFRQMTSSPCGNPVLLEFRILATSSLHKEGPHFLHTLNIPNLKADAIFLAWFMYWSMEEHELRRNL